MNEYMKMMIGTICGIIFVIIILYAITDTSNKERCTYSEFTDNCMIVDQYHSWSGDNISDGIYKI